MSTEKGDVTVRPGGGWADREIWVGDGLRREAFFFPSRGVDLYGSVYAADPPRAPLGVVICNSWGYEANLAGNLVHRVSLEVARAGGVAMSFHYPGFGDSRGEYGAATIDVMAAASAEAVREAVRRYSGMRWILVGLMLGSSVAALAAACGEVEQLLLVQPALRPGRYFARLERASKRSLGGPAPEPAPGFAFGYRLPPALLEEAPGADAGVEAALADFSGRVTIVRHERPDVIEGVPARAEQVCAAGAWRFGLRNLSELSAATESCLRSRLAEEG